MMITRTTLAGILLIVSAGASSAKASTIAFSDWENASAGVDGWSFFGDGTALTRVATNGNPVGFLRVRDIGTGAGLYFAASSLFLGDQSAAYGGTLSFDLQTSTHASPLLAGDVVLVGGGITLVQQIMPSSADLPPLAPAWKSYSASLSEAGWQWNSISGAAASAADLQTVLASLTAVRIRAEFSAAGGDTGGIDNVRLSDGADTPEPKTLALVGAALIALSRRRRQGR